MRYSFKCPYCKKKQDYNEELRFCGGCGRAVQKNFVTIIRDGSPIEYECPVCNTKMPYNGEAKFCGRCGTNIILSAVRIYDKMNEMTKKREKLEKEQQQTKKENEDKIFQLKKDNYRKKRAVDLYKEFCSDENISLEKAVKKTDAIVEKMKGKLEENRQKTRLFMTDELYRDCWDDYCKRLFPKQEKGGAISPVHIFNAYMMCKNRRDYLEAYSFSPLYVLEQNGVYIDGTNQDINLYQYREVENDIYMMFPSCNIADCGYERYSNIFTAEFSKRNTEKKYGKCYVKAPCVMEKKDYCLSLCNKGVLMYVTDEEYAVISKYYSEVVTNAKNCESRNKYYILLDDLYRSYVGTEDGIYNAVPEPARNVGSKDDTDHRFDGMKRRRNQFEKFYDQSGNGRRKKRR